MFSVRCMVNVYVVFRARLRFPVLIQVGRLGCDSLSM